MSYESPIEIVATQFRVEREKALEGEVLRAIHGLDITVHKEELIKALRYDRNQYDKGYKDGYDDGYDKRASALARKIFDEIEDVLNHIGYFDELDFETLKKKYTEEVI
jgi:hypothetical protein